MPKVNEEYKKNKRIQVLMAAFRCLGKKGYSDTTMRDIFVESKLSAGAVYNYFTNKEEIVRELVTLSLDSTKYLMDEITHESNRYNLPQLIVKSYLSKLKTAGSIKGTKVDISIWDAALKDKKLMQLVAQSFQNKIELFATHLLDAAKPDSKIDHKVLAQLLVSLIHGAALQKMINKDFNIEAYERFVTQLLETYNTDYGL